MVAWAQLCGFEPAKHHRLLIEKLEAVARGEIRRLMVFMPPGSAKSTYSSQLFPPWFLADREDNRQRMELTRAILTCSHSADLATSFGRRSRNVISDHEKELGYSLRSDSQAADEWTTTNGGEFFCAGVGGKIAGRRADLGLIDDPFGSREDAFSKNQRDKVWEWYKFDFRTRLKPNASIVLVNTRYHEDDLAGRLLASETGEWTVITLPLIAKKNDALGRQEGEILWPEYFNDQIVTDAKKDLSIFHGPYQQEPAPESGEFFKAEWLDRCMYHIGDLPSHLRYYAGSDHAVRPDEINDNSCLINVGVDENDVIWVLSDIYWDKGDTGEVVDEMIRMMKKYRHFAWWAGKDHITGAIGPFLNKRKREEKVYVNVEELPNHNKRKRELATAIQGRIKMGMVRFPAFWPKWPEARHELLSFDAGKHDDFVDALACIGRGLDQMLAATTPPPEQNRLLKPTRFTSTWLKQEDRLMKRDELIALLDR
jgi:hypothetical protein